MECGALSLLGSVTALRLVGDFVLSGEGACVSLHAQNSTNGHGKKLSCNVLRNYSVHGIEPRHAACGPTLLAVFGGKGVAVVELRDQGGEPELRPTGQLYELHDWIWDLRWLPAADQPAGRLALALGHNSVALCDYWERRILREVHCEEKCILYSACLVGQSWDELALVSGTVFNQLVLWRMEGPTDGSGRVRAGRRISGHSGVIFSIDYLEQNGVLASASDDRSIRLWKVGNLRRELEDSDCETECLLRLYGHQSRVWRVRLLEDHIISVGEDSACLVWSYGGRVTDTFRGHRGSVRALAVSEDGEWVATGGADSGIRLWKIGDNKPEDVAVTQLHFGKAEDTRNPRALCSVDPTLVLVMTGAGSIYSYCLDTGEWKCLLADPNYQSYGLLAADRLPSGTVLCVLGNIEGCLKAFPLSKPEGAVEWRGHQGKVHSLSWASRGGGQGLDRGNLFSSGTEGEMVWWEVGWAGGRVSWAARGRFHLPPCRHRWHTSAAFVPGTPYLVCGNRRGSVLLYPAEGGPAGAWRPISALLGLHGKSGVTSVLCHRGLLYSTGRDGCYRQLRVEEGGRLGLLRSQRACRGVEWVERLVPAPGGTHLLALGFRGNDFMAWCPETEQWLLRVPCGGGHRSWAFSSSDGGQHLFAYIKSGAVFACRGRLVAGGSGRVVKEAWHGREITCVRLVASPEAHTSVLVTGSEDTAINVLALDQASGRVTKLAAIGDHISSVRTLAVAGSRSRGSQPLLLSAGGRAELQCCRLLFGLKDTDVSLRCQVEHLGSHRLAEDWERRKNRHRMLKMDPETRYMSIVVVDGGMDPGTDPHFSWHFLGAACSDGAVRLFVIDEGEKKILLLAESFYHQRCVLKLQTFTHQLTSTGRRVFLCSAATDGRIALWDISLIIEKAKATNIFPERTHQPWDLGSPCLVFKAHQCGVNGLDIRPLDDGRYLLASGGDDNAIRVWVICVVSGNLGDDQLVPSTGEQREVTDMELMGSRNGEERWNNTAVDSQVEDTGWNHLEVITDGWSTDKRAALWVLKGPCVESAHAAHVTGLRILSSRLLASASIDQRLTHWALSSCGLSLVQSRWCQVADIAELEIWDGDPLGTRLYAVCGDGLQVLKSWQKGDLCGLKTDGANAGSPK
ncbi:WD repeat-containing protein 6 [Pristis pectinata]|uniref:WD repeat-containing protein 6 n=1 Tax=Pristis pectinata TaxID=685728 RepID=UPI00223CCF04|nr:WD repeat-containing protein 6 [Pristis pectinata]